MRAIAADRALAGDISCDSIAVAMVLPISIYVRVAMGCLASGFLGGRGGSGGGSAPYRDALLASEFLERQVPEPVGLREALDVVEMLE